LRHIGLAMVLGTLATVAAVALAAHDSVNQTTAPASSQNTNAMRHSTVIAGSGKEPAPVGQVGGVTGAGQGLSGLRDGNANLHHDQPKKPDQKAVLLGDGVLEQGL